jgi:hypothetical protein
MMGKKNQEEKNTFTSAVLLQFRTAGETITISDIGSLKSHNRCLFYPVILKATFIAYSGYRTASIADLSSGEHYR